MAYIGNQPLATAVTNADISSSAAIDLSKLATTGDLSATNVTLGGYLRGPSTFTIDPAAHGDNTGTLVIAGNLQVDGTQTVVNSTTMTVDDLNITVASGAANAAAADGAGITVDGASATLLYNATPDAWSFNKSLGIGTSSPLTGLYGTVNHISGTSGGIILSSSTSTFGIGSVAGVLQFYDSTNASELLRIDSSGNALVGKTTTAASTDGVALLGTNGINASRGDANVLTLNRNTSDGAIATFSKDGTTVGSIGVYSGDVTVGNGDVGLIFNDAVGLISPWDTTANAVEDNAIDLGYSGGRFKDLYLGGGVVETTTTVTYASSIALSYTNGAIQTVTLTGNVTFTDSLNDGEAIVLMLNGGASHTVTWTAVTKWVTGSGNAAPTLTASDAIILWKIGSSVYAATAGSFA